MWDDEIDAAARAETEVRAPRDFRARLLARIEARHGRAVWKPIGLSSAVAVAVVVILVVLIVNMGDRTDRLPREGAASNSGHAAAGPPAAVLVREPTGNRSIDSHLATQEPVRSTQVRSGRRDDQRPNVSFSSSESPAIEDLALPFLTPEERIADDPLTTDRLVTESLAINALELTPLDDQVSQ